MDMIEALIGRVEQTQNGFGDIRKAADELAASTPADERLRVWTARPYFKEHPGDAIALLSPHRADASEYLRKSVGNALRDISRKHPDLVRQELARWDLSDQRAAFTHKLAAKFL